MVPRKWSSHLKGSWRALLPCEVFYDSAPAEVEAVVNIRRSQVATTKETEQRSSLTTLILVIDPLPQGLHRGLVGRRVNPVDRLDEFLTTHCPPVAINRATGSNIDRPRPSSL